MSYTTEIEKQNLNISSVGFKPRKVETDMFKFKSMNKSLLTQFAYRSVVIIAIIVSNKKL